MEKYDSLHQQPLLHEYAECAPAPSGRRSRSSFLSTFPPLSLWLVQLVLLGASISMLLSSWQHISQHDKTRCVEKLSAPSPLLAQVSDEYEWRRYDGKVTNNPSPFKGPPIPETLARWENITRERWIRIDHPTLQQLGLGEKESSVVKTDDGGYLAGVEVNHQLHCLRTLWENTWPQFYHPAANDTTSLHREHLDHCADLLRQKLMCDADVSLFTIHWVKHVSHPTGDFNVLHKCRNFDDIWAWTVEHELQMPKHKPAGVIELDDFP